MPCAQPNIIVSLADDPVLKNKGPWDRGKFIAATRGENVQSALLDEQYFALRMQPDQPTELFDIFDDPGCKKNLADERQPLIERAETLFTEQHGESPWYPNLTLALKK